MRVQLIRRWREWPVGRVIEVFDTKAKELLEEGIAVRYEGDYPPSKKLKTELFNPKKNKKWQR